MTALTAVLGLLYLALFASLFFRLRDERAENRRLRQENTRLMIVMGERRGIVPPPEYASYRRPALDPAGPSAFQPKQVD